MTAFFDSLQAGRVWFAARPQFVASMREDVWRCGGTVCLWDHVRRSWCAYSRKGPARYAQTPADALKAVGYSDPVTP
jgi:hypothetical protein